MRTASTRRPRARRSLTSCTASRPSATTMSGHVSPFSRSSLITQFSCATSYTATLRETRLIVGVVVGVERDAQTRMAPLAPQNVAVVLRRRGPDADQIGMVEREAQ